MFISVFDNSLLEWFGVDPAYIFGGVAVLLLILFIICIVQGVKISHAKKRMEQLLEGSDAKSIEEELRTKFSEVNQLKETVFEHGSNIADLNERLQLSYSKTGIVKYDAFQEMGGNMSFALCLLDSQNNGFLLNSMHSREGCYNYIKEIINGESYLELSDEEAEALNQAVHAREYSESHYSN